MNERPSRPGSPIRVLSSKGDGGPQAADLPRCAGERDASDTDTEFVAWVDDVRVGTLRLRPDQEAGGAHRADLLALTVDPRAGAASVARALTTAAETTAAGLGRTLLIARLRATDPAVPLLEGLGYARVGEVAGYFRDPDGEPDDLILLRREPAPPEPATPADRPPLVDRFDPARDRVADLVETLRAAFAEYRDVLVPEPGALREGAASLERRTRTQVCFVARDGGTLVGCVFADPQPESLYLSRLAVRPAWRGRGVATALIAAAEAEARRRDLPTLSLAVRLALAENRRLFEHLGFVETSREAHPGFAEPTFANMTKRIA